MHALHHLHRPSPLDRHLPRPIAYWRRSDRSHMRRTEPCNHSVTQHTHIHWSGKRKTLVREEIALVKLYLRYDVLMTCYQAQKLNRWEENMEILYIILESECSFEKQDYTLRIYDLAYIASVCPVDESWSFTHLSFHRFQFSFFHHSVECFP